MTERIEAYERQEQTGVLLNANECSWGFPEDIRKEIQAALFKVNLNRYPDNDQTELLEAYASVVGVAKENLLAGNGSDQMLGILIGTFSEKGKTVFTDIPDFSMYDYYASVYHADIRKFSLQEDGRFSIPEFIAEGKKNHASMVIFSNPNNPTGHCLSLQEVEELLNGFKDIPVIVDEAYIEFADEKSSISLIDTYPNLYVTRTLSKAYGLAGARVGFMISCQDNMAVIKPKAVPYALNSLSMKTASVVLKHQDIVQKSIQKIKLEREKMYREISSLKTFHFFKSQANFLYGRCDHIDQLKALFDQENIRIRTYGEDCHFRITIGNEKENAAVMQVLRKYEELQ